MPSYRPKPPWPRVRAGHPLQSGLLRYYAFGEQAAGLLLDTVTGAHATLNAATESQRVTCPYGRAFAFAGGGNRAIASGAGLPQGSNPRSLAVLFRTTSTANRHLASWGTVGGAFFSVGINAGALASRNESVGVTIGSGLHDGNWHLAVFTTRPGNTIDVFADGQYLGERTLAFNTPAEPTLYLGSYQLDNLTFLGDMAMLAVWNRTLTPRDVTMLTADPFQVVRPRWPLVELLAATLTPPGPPPATVAPRVRWFPGLQRSR